MNLSRYALFFFIVCGLYTSCLSKTECIELRINSVWQPVSTLNATQQKYDKHWILAGTIHFRKKIAHQPIHLEQLIFSWKGTPLEQLTATLYEKPVDKKFFPLQEYLIAEGVWDYKKQHLIFKLNTSLPLKTHSIFCLVLSVPRDMIPHLANGCLEIEESSLPLAVRQALSTNERCIVAHRD